MIKVQPKLIALTVAAVVPLLSQAGPITSYSIWEQGETLVTDIPGAIIGGTKDAWTLTLPKGWEWNGGSKAIAEPDSSSRCNLIVTSPIGGGLLWGSDIRTHDQNLHLPDSAILGACTAAGLPVRVHVFDHEGGNNVPDSFDTAALLGLSLLGLLGAGAFFPALSQHRLRC